MSDRCAAFTDSIDAYVIGALDDDEVRALEDHAARCTDCASRIEHARRSSYALGLAVPIVQPGAKVKARVMSGAIALAAPRNAYRSHARLVAVAAAMLVVALGALTWTAVAQYRSHVAGHGTGANVSANESGVDGTLLDVASASDARRVQLTGTSLAPSASARYVWSASRGLGVLDVSSLPATDGASYEMTIVYASRSESGGTFTVDQNGNGALIVHDIESDDDEAPRGFEVTTTQPSGNSGIVLTGDVADRRS